MAPKKRAPVKAAQPEPTPAGVLGTKNICVAMDSRQRERLADMVRREPSWGHTQCVRHLMGVVDYLEAQLAQTPAVEAYAVHHHMTLPAARRKVTDWEWMVDTLVLLARERLAQLESRGKLPGGQ